MIIDVTIQLRRRSRETWDITSYTATIVVAIIATFSKRWWSRKNILTKTISWNWHLRLKHCRSKMINQLKKIDEIEIIHENASKIV
jgi:hypothetical protein